MLAVPHRTPAAPSPVAATGRFLEGIAINNKAVLGTAQLRSARLKERDERRWRTRWDAGFGCMGMRLCARVPGGEGRRCVRAVGGGQGPLDDLSLFVRQQEKKPAGIFLADSRNMDIGEFPGSDPGHPVTHSQPPCDALPATLRRNPGHSPATNSSSFGS